MITLRSMARYPSRAVVPVSANIGASTIFRGYSAHMSNVIRTYSTETSKPKKKKGTPAADISQIPIKNIGVIADFYIPPKLFSGPIKLWPKLLIRRLGVFVINTYSIVKYKRETGLKLKFDDWKESAMEKFVHTNKLFAASCNKPVGERAKYLQTQLDEVAGLPVISSLIQRSKSFPVGNRINWELVSIESNPKIISFTALPDANDIAAYVQFIMKVKTKQKVTMTNGDQTESNERVVSDNLVFTLNPFTNEVVLVGTIFESSYERGVQPELNFNNAQVMTAFQNKCGDIYRAPPKQE